MAATRQEYRVPAFNTRARTSVSATVVSMATVENPVFVEICSLYDLAVGDEFQVMIGFTGRPVPPRGETSVGDRGDATYFRNHFIAGRSLPSVRRRYAFTCHTSPCTYPQRVMPFTPLLSQKI